MSGARVHACRVDSRVDVRCCRNRIALLAILLASAAQAQIFQVAGVIVDAESNAPLKRVRIALAPSDKRTQQVAMITGEDGKFSFDTRAGKYSLTAERGGMRQTFGLLSAGVGFGSLVITGPDQDTAHLVFRWFPTGAITGVILDDRGEPAENALVQLIRVSVVAGRKHSGSFAFTRSDDRGHYRFGALTAGTYYLAVTAAPWYASRINAQRFAMEQLNRQRAERNQPAIESAEPPAPTPAFAPTYYPNATDARGATPLVLRPGAELRADFTLLTITGVNIHVNCPNAAGHNGMLSLLADGIDGVEGLERQINFNGHSQVIAGVPPGRYIVRIAGSGEHPFAVRRTIDVAASDITVDMTLEPPPTVSGKVVFKGPKPKGALYLRLMNEATNSAIARAVEQDGTFSFSNVAVARFRPLLGGTEGFFISQLTAEGATLTDGVLNVFDGATVKLNVVASDESGQVKGFVKNGEKPIPGALVVLAQPSGDPYEFRGFQTDSDGSFDFQNVPAGNWILFAASHLDLEYKNLNAVRPYLNSGQPLRIDAHGVQTQNIGLSPPSN